MLSNKIKILKLNKISSAEEMMRYKNIPIELKFFTYWKVPTIPRNVFTR